MDKYRVLKRYFPASNDWVYFLQKEIMIKALFGRRLFAWDMVYSAPNEPVKTLNPNRAASWTTIYKCGVLEEDPVTKSTSSSALERDGVINNLSEVLAGHVLGGWSLTKDEWAEKVAMCMTAATYIVDRFKMTID